MIKSSLNTVTVRRFPSLNELGHKFYNSYSDKDDYEKIKSLAGACDVPVGSVSFDVDGKISHLTIIDKETGGHITTVFDYYFEEDVDLSWKF